MIKKFCNVTRSQAFHGSLFGTIDGLAAFAKVRQKDFIFGAGYVTFTLGVIDRWPDGGLNSTEELEYEPGLRLPVKNTVYSPELVWLRREAAAAQDNHAFEEGQPVADEIDIRTAETADDLA